jgi:outer membrane protein TolC
LASAQKEWELANENVQSLDTLYQVGLERQRISAIAQSDILTLELDLINAQNALKNAAQNLKKMEYQFCSFLKLDESIQIKIELPEQKDRIIIPKEEALSYAAQSNPDYLTFKQEILEAEMDVERNKKTANFDSRISASIGFNQTSNNFLDAYQNPSQQDGISISVSIPLLDWGVKKGQLNMSKNNLNITKISIQQREEDLKQNIISTIDDFNMQQELIVSAVKALVLARSAYINVKDRFVIGKADVNSLTLALSRQKEAQRNYITILKYYWLDYFKLRRLTLYDFERQQYLSAYFPNHSN